MIYQNDCHGNLNFYSETSRSGRYSASFGNVLTHVSSRIQLTNAKPECGIRRAGASLSIHTSNRGISSHRRCLRRCNGLQGRRNRSSAIVCHVDRRRAAFYVPTTTTTTTQDSRGFGLTAETQSPIPRVHGKKPP